MSRTVFYNKLKGLTGSSPIDFVRKIKLNKALSLLESGYNVTEVAFKTGFSDVKYLADYLSYSLVTPRASIKP